MVRNCWPLGRRPTSSISTMCGRPLSRAAARASRSKRSRICGMLTRRRKQKFDDLLVSELVDGDVDGSHPAFCELELDHVGTYDVQTNQRIARGYHLALTAHLSLPPEIMVVRFRSQRVRSRFRSPPPGRWQEARASSSSAVVRSERCRIDRRIQAPAHAGAAFDGPSNGIDNPRRLNQ